MAMVTEALPQGPAAMVMVMVTVTEQVIPTERITTTEQTMATEPATARLLRQVWAADRDTRY